MWCHISTCISLLIGSFIVDGSARTHKTNVNDYGCIDRGELQFFPYFFFFITWLQNNDNDGTRHIQIPGRALSSAFWLFLFPTRVAEGRKRFQRSPSRLVQKEDSDSWMPRQLSRERESERENKR